MADVRLYKFYTDACKLSLLPQSRSFSVWLLELSMSYNW